MNGLGQLVTVPWKQQQRRTELSLLDPAPVQVTWQIVVGAIENGVPKLGFDFVCLNFAAGVTPFVVAGIEFSKRIIAQKRCEVCGGSGLVLREKEKDYLRCPECGMIAFTSSSSHIMYSIKYAAGRMLLNVSEIFLIYGAL
ncbi:hypothetical protein glysoja_025913 [Glycine soja]|uniref:Viral late gene transcription factor 3 zinc ribbon domain-containing protein n=1 Tax=Glycine soja TaxID=3848 RepID=A0A0B2SHZ4_GLYSO|nr:hypothetical protein glysoja_025913 [Glycine soja]